MVIDSSVMQNKTSWIWILLLSGAVFAAAFFKLGLLSAGVVPFNSDEAIVALMAKHILQGDRPYFFLWSGLYGEF